jgi:hypothetical protein
MSELWEGDPPLCPSEQSARWSIRQLKPKLIAADAVAFLRGRVYVHPERFASVLNDDAKAMAERRWVAQDLESACDQAGRPLVRFDFDAVARWAADHQRKPAIFAFTAGLERNVALLIERAGRPS